MELDLQTPSSSEPRLLRRDRIALEQEFHDCIAVSRDKGVDLKLRLNAARRAGKIITVVSR